MVERSPGRSVARGVGIVVLVVAGIVVVLAVVLYLMLLEQSTPDDGDGYADGQVREAVAELAADLEPRGAEPLDAENLAQRAQDASPGAAVVVLGWEGDSGAEGGAVVEVAVQARTAAWSGSGLFSDSRTEGYSLSCWRFTVHARQYDGEASRDQIGCPDDLTTAPLPDPTPLPSLGPDAEAFVLGVLDELPDGTGPAAAEAALRGVFQEFVDVRTERDGDRLVAAVGVVRSRDCIVGVRPDGEPAWRFSDFRRIQLEPGEGGCEPGLYLRPITTH
ncbi:hypothetical protein [Isoptericola aurantiacus]|uniref:hypothetical protein n=1 Tax=Isoptericola aurantiacus TaxID=3377839 RepID=UPI003839EB47